MFSHSCRTISTNGIFGPSYCHPIQTYFFINRYIKVVTYLPSKELLSGGGALHQAAQTFPNFSFTPFKRRGELIWSWQSNLTAKISTSCCYLLLQCSERVPVPPAYLSACVITLVTLEALLVLVRLLMLYEGIAFMKHSITIATLLALFNVGMLLSQMNT